MPVDFNLRRNWVVPLLICAAVLSGKPPVYADDRPCVPVTGFAQAELAVFDDIMLELMCAEGASAAVMGMMIDGRIVAQRGYGWADEARTRPLSPDALMRIASITKPLVASVIRDLIDDGLIALDSRAFDLNDNGGVLPVDPFPKLGDERLADVTIEHLLLHRGGWDRGEVGDLTYREVAIARAMDVPSPPGRKRTVDYILGQPVQFAPGDRAAYSNVGYLVLGMIVEHVTGEELVDVIHQRVLAPLGVKRTDLVLGRTFREDQCDREPPYDNEQMVVNVFDPDGPRVLRPYGGWHHEARVGQGGLITTTETLLKVLDARFINGPNIGKRTGETEGRNWRYNHGGALHGLNAIARQRGDGVNFAVMINKRTTGNPSYSNRIREAFDEALDSMSDVLEAQRAVQR